MEQKKEKIIKLLIEKLKIKIKAGSLSLNVSDDFERVYGWLLKIEKGKNINILIQKFKKKYILTLQLIEDKDYSIEYKDKLFFNFYHNDKNYKDIECLFNLVIKKKIDSFYEEIEKMIDQI